LALVGLGHVRLANAQTPGEMLASGMRALEAHDFAKAQQAFLSLTRRDPSARNYYFLALAEGGEGNLKHAILDFQKCTKLGGDASPGVHYDLGLA
jgi:hypothetical protein